MGRAVLAGAILCGGCSAMSIPVIPLPEPLAEIPIEIRYRLPTVDVRISGAPFKLFLDLGGHRAIALTTAELSRVPVRFSGTWRQSRNSHGQILQSRDFVAENVVLAEFPLGDVEGGELIFGSAVPPEQNGYIGIPILGRYLLVIDYPTKRVRFYKSGDLSALARECGTRTFDVALVNGEIPQTIGTTEFGNRLFLWDTGSTDNVIRPAALPSDRATGSQIDDGPPVVNVNTLKLGQYNVAPQRFRVVPFGAPEVDAYLGYDLFASRRVCLDIPQGKGAVAEPSNTLKGP